MALCFVPISIAALAGIRQEEAGLASGLINTTQQIGGAVGIALLSSIAVSATEDKLGAGVQVADALVSGFQAAFWVGAAIAAAGFVAALVLIRDAEVEPVEELEAAEPVPVG